MEMGEMAVKWREDELELKRSTKCETIVLD